MTEPGSRPSSAPGDSDPTDTGQIPVIHDGGRDDVPQSPRPTYGTFETTHPIHPTHSDPPRTDPPRTDPAPPSYAPPAPAYGQPASYGPGPVTPSGGYGNPARSGTTPTSSSPSTPYATPPAHATAVLPPSTTIPPRPPTPNIRPTERTVLPGGAGQPRVVTTRRPSSSSRGRRPSTRRARLTLTRIDPWSALKTSLVFATFLFVVWMVAVTVLYSILNGAGVFRSINDTLSDVLGGHISFSGFAIIGGAAILGAFNVVILTALGTVAAFAYNVTASLIGGIDVTLTESD